MLIFQNSLNWKRAEPNCSWTSPLLLHFLDFKGTQWGWPPRLFYEVSPAPWKDSSNISSLHLARILGFGEGWDSWNRTFGELKCQDTVVGCRITRSIGLCALICFPTLMSHCYHPWCRTDCHSGNMSADLWWVLSPVLWIFCLVILLMFLWWSPAIIIT